MIRYLSIVFILLFILQISVNTFVFIQFKIQQEYISKELCVERNESVNTCKGSCYLKTQLQKQETDSDFSISYLKDKVDLYFNECDFKISMFYFFVKEIFATVFYIIPIQNSNDIFHPPA